MKVLCPQCMKLEFLRAVRDIMNIAGKNMDSERAARLTAFGLLCYLDGSGEHWRENLPFRICYEDDKGEFIPLEFLHHEL